MKNIALILGVLLLFSACESFEEMNTDTKNPKDVKAQTLFTGAQKSLFDFMTSTNVNVNVFKLWAQHWTETTYVDEANYDLTRRNINGYAFDIAYGAILRDLNESYEKVPTSSSTITAEQIKNQRAIIEVLRVYTWQILVDIFGDVPYSSAFNIDDVTPQYDDDEAIYMDLISRLDAAIADLDGVSGLGSADLVYSGNVASWKKFANSLKLKMGVRIADHNSAKGIQMCEEAFAAGVMDNLGDNFELVYQSSTPNTNPLWVDFVQSGRYDFVASNTLVDYMVALNDPRLPLYFEQNLGTDTYVGGVHGRSSSYSSHTHITETIQEPTFRGQLMSATEVTFLLAEAAARGATLGNTAEEYYDDAIAMSITEWGGSSADVSDYFTNNPSIAYDQATWREQVGLQKWIAMYNRGFEAWTTFRLYDAPAMNLAYNAGTVPPNRFNYSVDEYSVNKTNVTAAASKFNDDDTFGKIFWDKF